MRKSLLIHIFTIMLFTCTNIYAVESSMDKNSNNTNISNADHYNTYNTYGNELVFKYTNRNDILAYLQSPYITSFNSYLNSNFLNSYALPYYGNLTYYGSNESPLSRFSTGITGFTKKSMAIFDKEGENTLLSNDVSNILINSLLGYFTNNIFGLNIWNSSDIQYVSGFEAIIKPFKNMQFSYAYMIEQHINMSVIELKFGYNSHSNIAVKNMHTFSDTTTTNTTTGVEWQFYF